MNERTEVPEWLRDIVYRIRQSHLTISIDDMGQFNLSDSLRGFLREIVAHAQRGEADFPNASFNPELLNLNPKEMEEVKSIVEIVVAPRDQVLTQRFIQHQFNFFAPSPPAPDTFEKHFGLPNEFSYFTGRKNELDKLSENTGKPSVIAQKISGTAGVGKSVLASFFAHLCLKNGRVQWVIWMTGGPDEESAKNNLRSDFAKLGKRLGLDIKDVEVEDLYCSIFKRLDEKGDGLIVFDNIPTYAVLPQFIPSGTRNKINIVITTPNSRHFGDEVFVIPLDVFTPEDAKQYIQHRLKKRVSDEEAEQLAKTLGYYPLAITQAIAYLADNEDCSVKIYCERYSSFLEARNDYMNESVPGGDPYEQERQKKRREFKSTMRAVIQLSLEQVKTICKTNENYNRALTILRAASYMAPEAAIPKALLRRWLPADPAELHINPALAALKALSLLEERGEAGGYYVHQVVQDVFKVLDDHDISALLLRWPKIILDYLYFDEFDVKKNINLFEGALFVIEPHAQILAHYLGQQKLTPEILEAKVLMHLHAGTVCLAHGKLSMAKLNFDEALSCQSHFSCNELLKAHTLINLGSVMVVSADSGTGLKNIENGLEIIKKAFGLGHPTVGYLLCILSSARLQCNKFQEAKRSLQMALPILQSNNIRDVELGACWLMFGSISLQCDDPNGALGYLKTAMGIFQKLFGEEDTRVGLCYMLLGGAYLQCNEPEEAKKSTEAAMSIFEKLVSAPHVDLGRCWKLLGMTALQSDAREKAKNCFDKALAILRDRFGEQHPEVGLCWMYLGDATSACGDHITARLHSKKAIQILSATQDQGHPNLVLCHVSFGMILLSCDEPQLAMTHLQAALPIIESNFVNQPVVRGRFLSALGRATVLAGDVHAARNTIENALPLLVSTLGDQHSEVGICRMHLGVVLIKSGALPEALRCLNIALGVLKKSLGEKNNNVAGCTLNLGNALISSGNLREGEKTLNSALIQLKDLLGNKHVNVGRCLMSLGVTKLQSQNLSEAESISKNALAILQDNLGNKHPEVAGCLMNLGLVYNGRNMPQKAIKYFNKAISIFKEKCGDKGQDIGKCYVGLGNAKLKCTDRANAVVDLEKGKNVLVSIFGDAHTDVGECYMSLGVAKLADHDLEGARNYCDKARKIFIATIGEEHFLVGHSWMLLGMIFGTGNNFVDAIVSYENALKIFKKTLPPKHDLIVNCEALFLEAISRTAKPTDNTLVPPSTVRQTQIPAQRIRQEAAQGILQTLRELLQLHPNQANIPDQTPGKGLTALHWAVKNRHPDHVECLLESIGFILTPDAKGLSALDYALETDQVEILGLFCKALFKKYTAQEFDEEQLPKLVRVCAKNANLPGLKCLIRLGVSLDERGPESGQTALHIAITKGAIECVELLLSAGANPDSLDKKKITPRILASKIPQLAELFPALGRAEVDGGTADDAVSGGQYVDVADVDRVAEVLASKDAPQENPLVTLFNQVLKMQTYSTQQILQVARACFDNELITEAVDLLEIIIEKEFCLDALILSAECDLARYQFDRCSNTISNCLKLVDEDRQPKNLSSLLKRNPEMQQEAKDLEDKLTLLRVGSEPSLRDQIKVVALLCSLSRFEEALPLIDKILSQKPEGKFLAATYYSQALCYFAFQHYDKAQRSLKHSQQLNANDHTETLTKKLDLALQIAPLQRQLIEKISTQSKSCFCNML